MKFEQLVERFLRLERWFKKYQDIVHRLAQKIASTIGIHQDIVKRYSQIQKDLDEIKARQNQEKSFRDSTRHDLGDINKQLETFNESLSEIEEFRDNLESIINNNKKLKKLFNQEES